MQLKKVYKSRLAAVVAGGAVIVVASAGTGFAAAKITSEDIKNHTIKNVDLAYGSVNLGSIDDNTEAKLKGQKGDRGPAGPNGVQGAKGVSGLEGAVYRVEVYNNGGGGSATVACDDDPEVSQTYTAISGGVQGGTVETQGDGFTVNSSFPGRMNWDTNEVRPNRLDGWIVFGSGDYTETLRVWALCVPNTEIDTVEIPLDN